MLATLSALVILKDLLHQIFVVLVFFGGFLGYIFYKKSKLTKFKLQNVVKCCSVRLVANKYQGENKYSQFASKVTETIFMDSASGEIFIILSPKKLFFPQTEVTTDTASQVSPEIFIVLVYEKIFTLLQVKSCVTWLFLMRCTQVRTCQKQLPPPIYTYICVCAE
eukprot:TRINITY_DN60534_c0_g1_i1.p3 TRINITY_DN60534_c0_g1~~TRINITY_DN60534_c0_g1_i1.p3  ORF type:complete len:185 (+),score=14.31 TRINITY_DN60534_c0_g1_i1:61-555(+)